MQVDLRFGILFYLTLLLHFRVTRERGSISRGQRQPLIAGIQYKSNASVEFMYS